MYALSQRVDNIKGEAKRFADFSDSASSSVCDDLSGKSRSIASVLRVDVLNDLFSSLVLEIDVYIGWLLTLFADEASKEEVDLLWINCGNAKAEADR